MNTQEKISREFSRIVTEWLGVDTMRKVIESNLSNKGTIYEDCCDTGNYCDSNEAMIEAFENVLGRSLTMSYDEDGNETEELMRKHEEDFALINFAWDMAKKNNFYL
jgi:hypothetical protein